ncbi:hypothetical protein VCHC62B1_3183B, partial [Vibrio cholerae HC-62B1]
TPALSHHRFLSHES